MNKRFHIIVARSITTQGDRKELLPPDLPTETGGIGNRHKGSSVTEGQVSNDMVTTISRGFYVALLVTHITKEGVLIWH